MIYNIKELCEKGVYFGVIGRQNRESEEGWDDFVFPKKVKVDIKSIDMGYNTFIQVTEETLFKDATVTLTFDGKDKTFDMYDSKLDDDEIINNYIEIQDHVFIGLEKDEVIERFTTEAKRILKGTWSAQNKTLESDALRNYLLTHNVEYFEEKCPELLI